MITILKISKKQNTFTYHNSNSYSTVSIAPIEKVSESPGISRLTNLEVYYY